MQKEVTLLWSAVPGATAYLIGRAVGGSGFRMICDLCSTGGRYVDRSAVPGLPHSYAVSAIFPSGISRRITSHQVTPGVKEVAATPGPQQTLPTATIQTTLTHTATPVTATAQTTTSPTATNPLGGMLSGVAGALTNQMSPVSPPAAVNASVTGPGTVLVTWQASPTTGVTQYRINRRVNGGAWEQLNTVSLGTLAYSDTFFPVTMFASGPVRSSYNVVALQSTALSPAAATGDLVVQPIVPTAGLPSTGTLAAVCRLDYQRADNMWAAFGRPDGPLGTETISLSPAQDKVFITDWKYEKTRNDGSDYYGSHLRIATNSGSSPIRLQLRSLTMTGLVVYARTGSDTFWIRMDPGSTRLFQADLMEVFCEK